MGSKEVFSFEKLRVYQSSLGFSKEIYKLTKKFPKDEIFGVTTQLRRAATSVPLNIAEGSSLTKKEFKSYLRRSRASLYECVPLLNMALENKYISETLFKNMYHNSVMLAKSISALIGAVK
jgi:four helix bundle protein